jgi:hypothetical protein
MRNPGFLASGAAAESECSNPHCCRREERFRPRPLAAVRVPSKLSRFGSNFPRGQGYCHGQAGDTSGSTLHFDAGAAPVEGSPDPVDGVKGVSRIAQQAGLRP